MVCNNQFAGQKLQSLHLRQDMLPLKHKLGRLPACPQTKAMYVMMALVKKVMDSLSHDASTDPLAATMSAFQQEDLLMHRDSDCP